MCARHRGPGIDTFGSSLARFHLWRQRQQRDRRCPCHRARPASCAGRKRPSGATFEKSPCTSSANSRSSEASDTRSSSTARPMSSWCGLSRGIRYGLPSLPNSRTLRSTARAHGIAQRAAGSVRHSLCVVVVDGLRGLGRRFPSAETPSSCQGRSISMHVCDCRENVDGFDVTVACRRLSAAVGALMNSGMGAISAMHVSSVKRRNARPGYETAAVIGRHDDKGAIVQADRPSIVRRAGRASYRHSRPVGEIVDIPA